MNVLSNSLALTRSRHTEENLDIHAGLSDNKRNMLTGLLTGGIIKLRFLSKHQYDSTNVIH